MIVKSEIRSKNILINVDILDEIFGIFVAVFIYDMANIRSGFSVLLLFFACFTVVSAIVLRQASDSICTRIIHSWEDIDNRRYVFLVGLLVLFTGSPYLFALLASVMFSFINHIFQLQADYLISRYFMGSWGVSLWLLLRNSSLLFIRPKLINDVIDWMLQ